jgi:uncharacterized RDD family membrane protein YckC
VSASIIWRFLRARGTPILPEVKDDLFSKKQIYQYAASLMGCGLTSRQIRKELVGKGLDIASAATIPEELLQTVEIQGKRYVLASLMERWLGQFLDGLNYLGLLLIPTLLFRFVTESDIAAFIGLVPAILYLLFQDGLTNGQSWGKRIVETKVIDSRTGVPCTFGQSFVRNLLLIIFSWIDCVFIFGEKSQRLGDKAAHTFVVKAYFG